MTGGDHHRGAAVVGVGCASHEAVGFHALHEQHYTFRLPSPVEFVNFHLTAFGTVDKPRLPRLRGKGTARDALKGRREVDFDVRGRLMATVYERGRLRPGAQVKGPAIIEEPAATTVVFPGQHASVDAYGNLIIAMKA